MVQAVDVVGEFPDRRDDLPCVSSPHSSTVDDSGCQMPAVGQRGPLQPFVDVLEVGGDLDRGGDVLHRAGDTETAVRRAADDEGAHQPRHGDDLESDVDAPHPGIERVHRLEAQRVAGEPGERGDEYVPNVIGGFEGELDVPPRTDLRAGYAHAATLFDARSGRWTESIGVHRLPGPRLF